MKRERADEPAQSQQRAAPATVIPSVIGLYWDVQAKVGEGTYGSVFKATDRRTGKEVAIKREPGQHPKHALRSNMKRIPHA